MKKAEKLTRKGQTNHRKTWNENNQQTTTDYIEQQKNVQLMKIHPCAVPEIHTYVNIYIIIISTVVCLQSNNQRVD